MCGQRGFTSTGDFNWPRGVAVDPVTGDYWIADTKQSDLQILEPLSDGCTGRGRVRQGGDGGRATSTTRTRSPSAAATPGSPTPRTTGSSPGTWPPAPRTRAPAARPAPTAPRGRHRTFSTPAGIAVDPTTGNVFVADSGNEPGGRAERQRRAGDRGGPAPSPGSPTPTGWPPTAPTWRWPRAPIRAAWWFSTSPTEAWLRPSPASPTPPAGDDLYDPQNVAFGPNGDLYIADTYNDRILEYSLSS